MVTHFKTNFAFIVQKLRDHGYTLQRIVDLAGLASAGHAHDICNAKQSTVSYDVGVRLMAEYKKLQAKERRRK
jgi:hypothetical protein